MSSLFGTDGVRGVANQDLTPELAFALGRAAGVVLAEAHERPTFLLGQDTRISGDMLACALAAGLASVGVDVWLGGVLPTPAVAWLIRHERLQGGCVISASHNPAPDNGLKFFDQQGAKLSDETEARIQALMATDLPRPTGGGVGRIASKSDLVGPYLQQLVETAPTRLDGLRVALDTANGATYALAKPLFERLGASVTVLSDQPDGTNINLECGSTHLDGLSQVMASGQFDLGVAFDGDGDRCLAVDEGGNAIDGDQMMFVFSQLLPALADNQTVVATVMSNMGFEQAILAQGRSFIRAKVGDRYVLEAMTQTGALLGGEQSGHIILPQYNNTGDGLLTAVQLASALKLSGRSLRLLVSGMPLYPQVLVNVRVPRVTGWDQHAGIQEAIGQAARQLGDEGRILVRASGTEPLIRIMLEGKDQRVIDQLSQKVADAIRQSLAVHA